MSPEAIAALNLLPIKAQKFCCEYIIDFDGKNAAIRAGYSRKSAHSIASRLLTRSNVSTAIKALVQPHFEELELTAERTMKEIARLAYCDPCELEDEDGKLKPLRKMSKPMRACIESYNWKKREVKLHSKNAALMLAARVTRIVDGDVSPTTNNNFVVVCPSDTPIDQWTAFAQQQMAQMKAIAGPSVQPTIVNGNGHLGNGHPHSNGEPA